MIHFVPKVVSHFPGVEPSSKRDTERVRGECRNENSVFLFMLDFWRASNDHERSDLNADKHTHAHTHITHAYLPQSPVRICLITVWLRLWSCQRRHAPSSCTNTCRSCLLTPSLYITRAFDSTSKATAAFHSAVRKALVQPGWEQLSGLPAAELAIALLLFGSVLFQLPVSFSFSSSLFPLFLWHMIYAQAPTQGHFLQH